MELTAQNVDDTLKACLFQDDNPERTIDEHVLVEGIMVKVGFSPLNLTENKENIRSMLSQLPDTFMESKGGGWSFLNACMTRDGRQWGEHKDMDALFILGIAVGLAKYLMDREMWTAFPGGMPYVVVLDKGEMNVEERFLKEFDKLPIEKRKEIYLALKDYSKCQESDLT